MCKPTATNAKRRSIVIQTPHAKFNLQGVVCINYGNVDSIVGKICNQEAYNNSSDNGAFQTKKFQSIE